MKNTAVKFTMSQPVRRGTMPLTKTGREVMGSMKKSYGSKKGKQVFYASMNKGVAGSSKWEGVKPHGNSPLDTTPMPDRGEPNNKSFLR